ncbi:MAG TPA: DsbA family protein, partial [Mycobacterium sp.]|nr:DsbA family protein [Mycobacterium sp.]
MATKPKRYDLKAADRKRNLLVQGGLAAVVVIFAVALVLYIVMSHEKKTAPGRDKAIQVTSSKLITKPGTKEPKVVLSLYEDFLCPACAAFEKNFGSTVNNLIDSGAVQADYHMVSILDRPQNQNYSSRAGAAAYCVADESIDAFRRFHAALYSPQIQPKEDG